MRRTAVDWFLDAGIFILFVVLLVPAIAVGFVIGHSSKQKTKTVVETPAMAAKALTQPAPRFTSSDLAKAPTNDWPTNGGDVFNRRYSALDQINTSNVSQLKGVWLTHLRGSALAAKYSAEGTPVEWKGVIYVPTGADDVFAVSADTGEILWQYKANLDQTISTVCCGWESRGVAIGGGKVFIGQLDGKLVALDQKTGQVVWQTQVARWQEGATITHAPLYVDGMVITGISGGEFGIRGRVTAFDAATGKEVWRFYTIPGPGQVGHDSWPAGNQWKHGGAPIWQTPAVDPKLGLLYFSTGNAANDLDGSKRPGDNLFTSSIVAIHLKDGTYAWHFQQVHHDIWDYDGPSPVVLFDHGGTHGIGEPSKTGWLYLLDRKTGKPLVPIVERPVPQDPWQKTSKTQPFPSNPPFVSHRVTKGQFDEIVKLTKATFKKGAARPIVNGKSIFAAPGHDKYVVVAPGAQGGDNWPPSSYDPDTNMFYVCGQSTVNADIAGSLQHEAKQGQVPPANFGSIFTATGFVKNPGTLTAIEATTGKIEWQLTWPRDSCYSGTTTTKGNLVFVGRNNGRVQSYDARNGKLLWSFQTGAGANNTGSFFEWKGNEYYAFYAGGNSLAGTAHGDNLWLFGLDGTLNQLPPPGSGKAVAHAGEANTPQSASPGKSQGTKAPSAAAGQQVFAQNCSVCHGAAGTGGNGGPDLTSIPSAKQMAVVVKQVENGGAGMPAFKGQLTQQDIENVSTYVTQKITNR
ncbi:MAG TPA: PQQ-binding-like beta-propeller repeat protein [Gaiellaceae bacterium]